MTDPAAWMLEEETATDRLRMALAEAHADLRRHDAALLKLQGELMASRLEVSGARGETVQVQGLLRRAEKSAQAFRARGGLESWDAEIMQLRAIIAGLQAETLALRAGMDLLRTSASWRISAPVRVAGRLLRGIRMAGRGLAQAIRRPPPPRRTPVAHSAAALPSLGDANARFIFQAGPPTEHPFDEEEGVVTLNALYHLSRSL